MRERYKLTLLIALTLLAACAGERPAPAIAEVQAARSQLVLSLRPGRSRIPWICGGRSFHMQLLAETGEVIEIDYPPVTPWPESIVVDVPAGPLQVRAHDHTCFNPDGVSLEDARALDRRACRKNIDVRSGAETSVVVYQGLGTRCRIALATPEPIDSASNLELQIAASQPHGSWYLDINGGEPGGAQLRMPNEVTAVRFSHADERFGERPRVSFVASDGDAQAWNIELQPGRQRLLLEGGEPLDPRDSDGDAVPDALDACPDEHSNGALRAYGCPFL